MLVEKYLGLVAASAAAVSGLSIPRAPVETEKRYILEHARRSVDSTSEYEYVVVGSGPGGGPLAARLALAGHSVLLIDAGDDYGNTTEQMVPALNGFATEYVPMKWDYFVHHYANTTRQQQDSKMVWRTAEGGKYVGKNPPDGAEPLGILYPRAGTLGGCGSHNSLVSIYPHENDWKYIQDLTNDDSWSPSNMRTYFEKLERNRYLPNSVDGHGFNGWLETSLADLSPVATDQKLLSLGISAAMAMSRSLAGKVISTATEFAQALLTDMNAPGPERDATEGLYRVPLAITAADSKRNGPREFILDVANAVNDDGTRKYHLDISLNTLVTKVRFDQSGLVPKAVGVDYLSGQSLYAADPRYAGAEGISGTVKASKEVIIAAGAFNTPQLLKLSGVGPRDELEKFGIEVVKELPGVGTNMQDRYETGLISQTETGSPFNVVKDCTWLQSSPDPCLERWKNGPTTGLKGVYASSIGLAIVKKSSSVAEGDDPDLMIFGGPVNFPGYYPGFARGTFSDAKHWTWLMLKGHSRNNKGTVKLRSADPRDVPEITFNSFDTGNTEDGADEKDLQASYEAMEMARRMTNEVIPLDGSFTETWPGANVSTEAEMKQFIKDEAWGHHASCTCPIGADGDENAVLDSEFRVRGVNGLRVVDASVFPKIPGFFLSTAIYVVSEKAADVIINGPKVPDVLPLGGV